MAIKLYKSQLEPTTQSSNVLDQRKISMSEAGAVGRAFKGFVNTGERLYVKHQEIKSEKEVLEKIKTVMNGKNGLAAVKLNAAQMDDPDKAMAYYNNEVEKVKGSNSEFTGLFSKKKFNSWLTKQSIEDGNTIKVKSTANLIEGRKTTELEYLETLKKKVIFAGSDREKNNATIELETRLNSTSNTELFGNGIEEIKSAVAKDIAFYGYKRVALDQQDQALELAKKDDRLSTDDVLKLETHFKTSSTTSSKYIKSTLSDMSKMVEEGISPDINTLNGIEQTAKQLGDNDALIKVNEIKANLALVSAFNNSTQEQIESFIQDLRSDISTGNKSGKGSSTVEFQQLKLAENYLSKLKSDLKSDPINAVSKRGTFNIQNLDLQNFLLDPVNNKAEFIQNIIERKSQADAIGSIYGIETKYLSEVEKTNFTALFSKLDNPEQIKQMSSIMVQGFGDAAPDVFKELSEKNSFLAHIGGLSLVSEGKDMPGITLAINGYLLNKEKNIDIKVKDTDTQSIKDKYKSVFPENRTTYNTIIETANNIYSELFYNSPKYKNGVFQKDLYDKAMLMAMGQNGSEGGVGEYNGKKVHVPNWLQSDEFEDVIDFLKLNPEMLKQATGSYVNGKFLTGQPVARSNGKIIDLDIFEGGDPYLISVGYGKYKVAMQDHPNDPNPDPRYAIDGNFANEGNNYLIIDLNLIKSAWNSR